MAKKILFFIIFLSAVAIAQSQDVLYLDGGGANPNFTIQSGAQVYVQGGYVANAGSNGMELDGGLHLKDGTTSTSSNWTDNMASSSVSGSSTGIVYLESGLQQNVTGDNTTFYNLVFNNTSVNTSGVRLLTDIKVSNQVTFQDGLVYANSNKLLVLNTANTAVISSAPNTSTFSGSWIAAVYPNGSFDRNMTNSGSVYAFPVGSTSAAQLLEITPTTITGITRFSASWENGVVGSSPISITECGNPYFQVNNGGEWHLRPANGGVAGSGSFSGGNMTIRGWNLSAFPGLIDNQFAIVWRAQGSAVASGWAVPNPGCTSLAGVNASGRTVTSNNAVRNNIASFNDGNSQLGIASNIYILPIELLSFTGYNEGSVNQLFWNTASETNSDYFDLERSALGNDNDFQSIGRLAGAGHSLYELNYHFTDEKPHQGLNYYRLKMVDRDNSFIYSNVVLIETRNSAMTIIFPNPATDELKIRLQSERDDEIVLHVTDETGRVLRSEFWNVRGGNNETTLNTTDLIPGAYLLNVFRKTTATSETYKIVKAN